MLTSTFLACALLQSDPTIVGRWISTECDLGGIHAIAAMPDGRTVATLNAELGLIEFGHGDEPTAVDLSYSLHHPKGLAVGDDGRVYVADSGQHRVMFFDGGGVMLGGFGGPGDGPFRMRSPQDIDGNSTLAAVADTGHYRIQLFHLNGKHLRHLEGPGLSPR